MWVEQCADTSGERPFAWRASSTRCRRYVVVRTPAASVPCDAALVVCSATSSSIPALAGSSCSVLASTEQSSLQDRAVARPPPRPGRRGCRASCYGTWRNSVETSGCAPVLASLGHRGVAMCVAPVSASSLSPASTGPVRAA